MCFRRKSNPLCCPVRGPKCIVLVAPARTMCVQRVLVPSQLEMGSRYTLRYVVRLGCPVYGPRCVCLISYVLDSYWSSSRHLLCVYFFCRAPWLCSPVPGRVVLCVPVNCATHCIVAGFHGWVCHLLQGTCSVCTFAVCYGCAALCLDVSYCVSQCAVLHIAWYMGFADMCATYFKALALNVRLPCAMAMPPCAWTCRTM